MGNEDKQPFLTRFFIAQAKRITVPFIKGIEDMFLEENEDDGSNGQNNEKNNAEIIDKK